MKNPAREKFGPMLSPYVDGELSPEERKAVEQHLQLNKDSAAQVDDFRAADALMRHALDLQADGVDFAAMTESVMSRLTPDKPPFFERLKLTLSELFTYQRGTFIAATAGAAFALAVAVPVALSFGGAHDGYANSRVEVQTVSIDSASTAHPVVMETDQGDAIIWTVEQPAPDDDGGKKKKKKRDEDGEEEVVSPDAKEGPL